MLTLKVFYDGDETTYGNVDEKFVTAFLIEDDEYTHVVIENDLHQKVELKRVSA